jgi:outer membrane assembly lipoprotein YfiO
MTTFARFLEALMQSRIRWIVLLILMAGLAACGGSKGAKLQKSVIPPDKTLYQNGADFLKKSEYTQARLAFQTLIRTYPGSELEAEAYFSMGDSFMNEGGTENLLMAEDQFRNFIIFFPTHPKAPAAQMKIISILMEQMRSPDRDQKETVRAEAEIQKYLQLYSDNDFAPIVKQFLDEVRENLALRDMAVGDFYDHVANPSGAYSRYKEILDKYPHFSRRDEASYKLAESYLRMSELLKQVDNKTESESYEKQAIETLNQVAAGFPFSEYFDDAKAELARLGKPIPPVDAELAARNQALVKPEIPFTPLRPLIDIANAMGFIPVPNRYAQAVKAVEQAKAAAAAAAASSTDTKPADPRINLGTIEKGADGKAVPKVAPAATDKKGENTDPKAVTKK